MGVYVPVFDTVGTSGTIVYAALFPVLVGVWCAAGRFVVTRPVIATVLCRWGQHPAAGGPITIGLIILTQGGAFGL
jgi:cadmium resistance protein CadD (predicted permease)